MNNKKYALLGIIGPLIAYVSIGISIFLSPWFSWYKNALSDLGHAIKSEVAIIFNIGLVMTGFVIIIYSITTFTKHARYTSIFLTLSSLFLQLIGTLDEVYGFPHFIVSVLFFLFIIFTSITYTIEKKSILALLTIIISLISWVFYFSKIYNFGIAIPEILSSSAIVSWVMMSSLKIYFNKN